MIGLLRPRRRIPCSRCATAVAQVAAPAGKGAGKSAAAARGQSASAASAAGAVGAAGGAAVTSWKNDRDSRADGWQSRSYRGDYNKRSWDSRTVYSPQKKPRA